MEVGTAGVNEELPPYGGAAQKHPKTHFVSRRQRYVDVEFLASNPDWGPYDGPLFGVTRGRSHATEVLDRVNHPCGVGAGPGNGVNFELDPRLSVALVKGKVKGME
jgi:hypothetical protein